MVLADSSLEPKKNCEQDADNHLSEVEVPSSANAGTSRRICPSDTNFAPVRQETKSPMAGKTEVVCQRLGKHLGLVLGDKKRSLADSWKLWPKEGPPALNFEKVSAHIELKKPGQQIRADT